MKANEDYKKRVTFLNEHLDIAERDFENAKYNLSSKRNYYAASPTDDNLDSLHTAMSIYIAAKRVYEEAMRKLADTLDCYWDNVCE